MTPAVGGLRTVFDHVLPLLLSPPSHFHFPPIHLPSPALSNPPNTLVMGRLASSGASCAARAREGPPTHPRIYLHARTHTYGTHGLSDARMHPLTHARAQCLCLQVNLMTVQQPEFVTGSYCFVIASSSIAPRTAQVLSPPQLPARIGLLTLDSLAAPLGNAQTRALHSLAVLSLQC